jgi:hypothetical protein
MRKMWLVRELQPDEEIKLTHCHEEGVLAYEIEGDETYRLVIRQDKCD